MRTYRRRPRDHLGTHLHLNGYVVNSKVERDTMSTREEVFVSWARPPTEDSPAARRVTVAVSETFFEESPHEVEAESWAALARHVGWGWLPEALAALYAEGPSWAEEGVVHYCDASAHTDSAPGLREYRDEQARRFGVPRAHGKLQVHASVPPGGWRASVQDEAVDYDEAKLAELMARATFSDSVPNAGVEPPVFPDRITHLRDRGADRPACGARRRGINRPLEEFPATMGMGTCDDCLRLARGRRREEVEPLMTAFTPAIDRSGPRVFCQSQYDPDE